ncbi:MAG: hypothetical protein P9M03_02930 [Candidatus Theseobacter exili]|nr:hypothetical protein [Candidatus Theseobacter exili]
MNVEEVKEYYLMLDSDELIRIAKNLDNEYEDEAAKIAGEILAERGIAELPEEETQNESIQCATVKYYIEDAFGEIGKILTSCKHEQLDDEELLPSMEHALHMFNAAFNLRYHSMQKISELSEEEWEEYLLPPKEIFGDIV